MNDMNDELDKAKGKVEETAGSVTGDEKLEAKGKINQKKAEFKEGANDAAENVEQKVAGAANDVMDKLDGSDK